MKKIIALLLCIAIMLSLAACSSGKTADNANPSDQSKTETKDTGKKIKIGYTFPGLTSAGLLGDCKAILDLAAEALGIEVLYNTDFEGTAENIIKCTENFIAAGCDGVIVCNYSEASLVNIGKTCEEAGVYWAQFFRTVSGENIAKQLSNYHYYVGRVHEDEFGATYNMAKAMIDKGASNVALIASQHGDLTYETRAAGYRAAFEEAGVKIVTEEWDVAVDDCTNVATNILTAFPEVDGFALTGAKFAPYVIAAEENLKTGYKAMAGIDFDNTLEKMLNEGSITAIGGGHHSDPLFALLMVYNAINGAYNEADFPLDVENNLIFIESLEDYSNYNKYVIGYNEDFYNRQTFTMDEIRDLAITFNPNTTIEDIRNAASSMSIQDVMTRHAELVK